MTAIQRTDEFDDFGRHVAAELRSIAKEGNAQSVGLAKLRIQEVIYQLRYEAGGRYTNLDQPSALHVVQDAAATLMADY